MCSCKKRINYAAATHRLNPAKLEYTAMEKGNEGILRKCKAAMEKVDDLSFVFSDMPFYRTSQKAREWIEGFLGSEEFKIISEGELN